MIGRMGLQAERLLAEDPLRLTGRDMHVRSVVLGQYALDSSDPTEGLAADVIVTDTGLRAHDVTMQSTWKGYEQHPNAHEAIRAAHVVDIEQAIITIGRRLNMPEPAIRALILQVAPGDEAHTMWAHLGDTMREGYGGPEKAHDL